MNRPGSRAILRAAFRTLKDHPRLLWFPAMTIFGASLAVGLGATLIWLSEQVAASPSIDLGPWTMMFGAGPTDDAGTLQRGVLAGGFLTMVLLQLWSLIVSVALSRAAMDAMAGRAWTLGSAVRAATSRMGAIATVAVAQAGVGRLLAKKKSKEKPSFFRRFTTNVLEMSWWAATYLVVPVLAKEKRGGIGSILRSGKLFRKTWKEAFVGRLALGWVWFAFAALAITPLIACAYVGVDDPRVLMLAILTPGVFALFGTIVMRTLDMIYRTALYVFATEGVVPEPFGDAELHDVFVVRK